MDLKLTILFILIGAIIGLSTIDTQKLTRAWRQLALRPWRQFVPARRRS
jgi:hypothetical protein